MTEEEERKARFRLDCFKEANETFYGSKRLDNAFKLTSLIERFILSHGMISLAFADEIRLIDESLDEKRREFQEEIAKERATYEQSEREVKNG